MSCYPITHLTDRKCFPCFHKVMVTRVEVWENELKSSGNTTGRQVFCFELSQTFHNFMETRKGRFLFLLYNKRLENFLCFHELG